MRDDCQLFRLRSKEDPAGLQGEKRALLSEKDEGSYARGTTFIHRQLPLSASMSRSSRARPAAASSGSGSITPCVNVHCPVTAYLPGSASEKSVRLPFRPPALGVKLRDVFTRNRVMRLSPTGSSLSSPWFLLLVLFIAFFVSAIHLTPRGADLSSRNSENFPPVRLQSEFRFLCNLLQ